MEFLLEPNVIYLLLMAGLWISATATYTLGETAGVAEVAGGGLLLGTIYLLSQLAGTNWLAVIALVLGAAVFFLLPLLKPDWELLRLAVVGLAVQVLASFMLFSGSADVAVSPFLIVGSAAVAWLYQSTVLRYIIQQRRELSSTQKDEFLVGERGRVMGDIDERGTVQVKGELWSARSSSPIAGGTEIVVTGQDGLELHVEKAKRDASG